MLFGVTAYGIWGMFPLFWVLLEPAGAIEVLAHRVLWSLIAVFGVLWLVAAAGRWRRGRSGSGTGTKAGAGPRPGAGAGLAALRAVLRDRLRLGLLTLAAVLLSINWCTFIWGVLNGHVVETSLGYFVTPLVSVLAGVLVLGERLRPLQWTSVGLGALAVLVLTVGYGRPPWIALTLAFTFGAYGLIKKYAGVGTVEALAVETTVLVGPAVGYLLVLEAAGRGTFFDAGPWHTALLVVSGTVTAIPLLAFGAAANRVPLSLLGLLQYLTPVLQFALGVLVFGEHMPATRWFGFLLVWVALSVLSWDGLRRVRARAVERGRAAVTPTGP